MQFTNPPADAIAKLLRNAKTIAVVGLSDNPRRPSYEVAATLVEYGYRIIPVNPALAVWEGRRAVPDLEHVSDLFAPGEQVDIVNVFRHPDHVDDIVTSCLRLHLPVMWLQLGVIAEAAARRAQQGGMTVIMDRCIKVDRLRLV